MGDTLTFEKPAFRTLARLHCQPTPGATTPVLPSVLMSRVADLVRFIFSDPANIWHTQIRSMIYDPDYKKTTVAVMMGFSTTPEAEQADVFPRIVISGSDAWFGEQSPVPNGLMTNSGSPGGGVFGMDNGLSSHNGRLAITCASTNALEALLMAESLAMYCITNRTYIQSDLHVNYFEVKSIRSPKAAERPEGVYESMVTIDWNAFIKWVSVEDLPPIGDTGASI